MSTTQNDDRNKFLIEMYNNNWANISRSDDAAWKMIASYAALLAVVFFIYDKIGLWVAGIILMLFSFFGMLFTLNQNLWFVRNIGIISNLEQEFLSEIDYGVIIPKKWKTKYPFINTEIYCLFFTFYLVMTIFGLILIYNFSYPEFYYCKFIFSTIIIITTIYGGNLWIRHNKFKDGAIGRKEYNNKQRK